MRRHLAPLFLLSLLGPATALASEPPSSPTNAEASDEASTHGSTSSWRTRRDLSIDVRPGVFYDGHGGGLSAGADILHRRGLLVLGVVADAGASPLFATYRYLGGGGAVGVSAPSPSWLRADLLYVMGAHSYSGVGGIFPLLPALGGYSEEPSSATLPFAGARLRLSVAIGSPRAHFDLGLEVLAETDIARARRSYEVSEWSLASFERRTETRTVGTERIGAALILGGAFDL